MRFVKIKYIALLAAVAIIAASCAEEPSESWKDNELMLIQSTVKMYFPTAEKMNEEGSLWLISHSKKSSGAQPQITSYVAFDYRGELLPNPAPTAQGKVFQTTNANDAKLLRTWAAEVHYAPIFLYDTTTMQQALLATLSNMREGDTAKVLSASWLAFGSSGTTTGVPANTPVIFTVALREVVPDPKKRELDMVGSYAASHPGFVPATDRDGNILTGIYVNYADTVPLVDTLHYPKDLDDLNLKYAGYYLQDGFLLDTDIDTIAQKFDWSTSDTTKYNAYFEQEFLETPGTGSPSASAFNIALQHVAPGSWVEVIFTSDYGYGRQDYTSSLSPTRPVYAYTPLRYRIFFKGFTE